MQVRPTDYANGNGEIVERSGGSGGGGSHRRFTPIDPYVTRIRALPPWPALRSRVASTAPQPSVRFGPPSPTPRSPSASVSPLLLAAPPNENMFSAALYVTERLSPHFYSIKFYSDGLIKNGKYRRCFRRVGFDSRARPFFLRCEFCYLMMFLINRGTDCWCRLEDLFLSAAVRMRDVLTLSSVWI